MKLCELEKILETLYNFLLTVRKTSLENEWELTVICGELETSAFSSQLYFEIAKLIEKQ